VQTGVKSFGCENKIAQPSPIHSWKLMAPSVVSAEKLGASSASERGLNIRSPLIPTEKMLRSMEVFAAERLNEIGQMRRLRNQLVHGFETQDREFINQTNVRLEQIMNELLKDSRSDVRRAAERALDREK
jgi:hypothetical protein